MTLKILIGRFSRNFFSRTAEGIELKSGIYVPMNVFNMCCYCLHHLKIQNGHQLSLLCIGQFVMAIILTCVLFCAKCAELLLDQEKQRVTLKIYFMRQYSQLFCLGLKIWISEMLLYHPELEVVELVQDGPRFFWDHLLPTAHVNSFLHYLAVSYK